MTATTFSLSQAFKQLEDINRWFQQDDIDLEEALVKLKEAKVLLKKSQDRLHEVENEFKTIKDELLVENSDSV